jgi:hypothetical protein
MARVPSPDRIDAATLGVVVLLLVIAYGLIPVRIVEVSVWITIIMVFICWTGYFSYRVAFGDFEASN